jgi:hypothetical protein
VNASKDPPRWSEADGDAPVDLQRMLASARRDVPGPRALAALGIALPNLAGGAAIATANAQAGAAAAAKAGSGVAASGVAGSAAVAGNVAGGGIVGASLAAKISAGIVVALLGGGAYYATQRSADPPPRPARVEAPLQVPVAESPRAELPPSNPMAPTVEPVPVEQSVQTPSLGAAPDTLKAPIKETELGLLQRARSALRADPSKALALVSRHQQEFPDSQFAQEREVIRIEALRKSGHEQEADRLGEKFNERYPGSAHETKLKHEGQ